MSIRACFFKTSSLLLLQRTSVLQAGASPSQLYSPHLQQTPFSLTYKARSEAPSLLCGLKRFYLFRLWETCLGILSYAATVGGIAGMCAPWSKVLPATERTRLYPAQRRFPATGTPGLPSLHSGGASGGSKYLYLSQLHMPSLGRLSSCTKGLSNKSVSGLRRLTASPLPAINQRAACWGKIP